MAIANALKKTKKKKAKRKPKFSSNYINQQCDSLKKNIVEAHPWVSTLIRQSFQKIICFVLFCLVFAFFFSPNQKFSPSNQLTPYVIFAKKLRFFFLLFFFLQT